MTTGHGNIKKRKKHRVKRQIRKTAQQTLGSKNKQQINQQRETKCSRTPSTRQTKQLIKLKKDRPDYWFANAQQETL